VATVSTADEEKVVNPPQNLLSDMFISRQLTSSHRIIDVGNRRFNTAEFVRHAP
jgi:hypothetical protein